METEATEREQTGVEAMKNRTGIMTSPALSTDLIEAAAKTKPSMAGDDREIVKSREAYITEGNPIGSLPMEDDIEQAVLLDKLGERLAFERQGTRLYEALINKCESLGEADGVRPSIDDLKDIHDEEKEHFALLQEVILDLGGDPTIQTPSADISGVLSTGVLQVLTDPRTTVAQCLQAALVAELSDNDGWEMLIELATTLDREDLAEKFEDALKNEQEHLEKVRLWLSSMTLQEADISVDVGEELSTEGDAESEETGKESRPKRKRRGTRKKKK